MAIPDVSQKTLAELISLRGRNAVITGGARGLGLAIAERLAEAGAGVLLGDLRADEGQAAAERLAARYQVRALFASVDVTDSDSVRNLAQRAVQELGSLDIWVNNAGIYPSSPVLEMSDEQWDRVLAINLRGTFLGAREAARCMIQAQRGGVIINLASTAGYQGGAGMAHYVASKHAVRGLTKSLAIEFGPYNIRVLALAPTLIRTPGIAELRQEMTSAGAPDVLGDSFGESLPLGRAGVPDDVARVALFCASDLSLLMTGSTLAVDAGALAS
ncbi:SDR family NAD(P)-dependent oxidoreductase [Thermogemmatispora tikiterensis]|uniref:Short-chain dehydrogenase n=1 Tax=Thermogemmatispora tikiterensis TaxID=1825093 RepID=A0A328VJA0_9CHLR|nr:SDR family NAD(P)-dependent oxidoreductase [Thermogemmatispora tikiterensis]RAQ94335.1 short-chain dehydrogenase [Thermogemmatispora tikiterensis]